MSNDRDRRALEHMILRGLEGRSQRYWAELWVAIGKPVGMLAAVTRLRRRGRVRELGGGMISLIRRG
jgi:hypothetical protein